MKTTVRNKLIGISLAAVAAVTSVAMLAGCGEKKDDAKAKTPTTTVATTAPKTTAATVAATATTAPNTVATMAATQAKSETKATAPQSTQANGVGISESEAIKNVKKQAGSGAQIVSSYQGTTPDGLPAWVVTVTPVSDSNDTGNVTYYSGYQFCYPAQNSAETADKAGDVGISESEAIKNVKKQAGSGAQIVSSYQGTTPDGMPAWVVTVTPVSDSNDTGNVTYYSGYQFCYAAE